jgi:hypothetical protein
MAWYDCEDSLGEILERSRKYQGESFWEDYVANRFMRLSMSGRAEELHAWEIKISEEVGPTTLPTREHADLVQRKRQLEDIHFGMLKVDR